MGGDRLDDQRQVANVYFDGFNFYYGCFKGTGARAGWAAYRWLDLAAFCANAFPEYRVNRIRYFTALVRPSPENPGQSDRQQVYLRALRTIPSLTVHEGRFATTLKWRYLAVPGQRDIVRKEPPEKVPVIHEEEKGSDVNLASHLLVDAFRGEFDVAVVVSNDSDLAEPIRLARAELGREVTLLNPRRSFTADLQGVQSHYRNVREWMLRDAQFPAALADEHGVITKPDSW